MKQQQSRELTLEYSVAHKKNPKDHARTQLPRAGKQDIKGRCVIFSHENTVAN